jgi:hypothetical protein
MIKYNNVYIILLLYSYRISKLWDLGIKINFYHILIERICSKSLKFLLLYYVYRTSYIWKILKRQFELILVNYWKIQLYNLSFFFKWLCFNFRLLWYYFVLFFASHIIQKAKRILLNNFWFSFFYKKINEILKLISPNSMLCFL